MRELDRDSAADTHLTAPPGRGESSRVGIVGGGRVGAALARALRSAGYQVAGPAGRDEPVSGDFVVLCVPDAEIRQAAAALAGSAPLVGHTSGAMPLSALAPAAANGAELFGLHPLQSFAGVAEDADRFAGCGCAVAGSTPGALACASELARNLGMVPFEIADEDRPTYHAAASIASNFLVALEAAAESVAAGAGLPPERARAALAPLVRTTVENWIARGPERALTGPVARGDELTVAAQRAAVGRCAPDLLALFDALLEQTRRVARSPAGVPKARAEGDAA